MGDEFISFPGTLSSMSPYWGIDSLYLAAYLPWREVQCRAHAKGGEAQSQ